MQLLVTRTTRTANSTIGKFSVNGAFFSYCLEPTDRDLTSDMTLQQIAAIKVQNKTCIPTGTYKITSYISPKHNNTRVPLLENVPGFAYVEIHVGNYPKDTDACLLLGSTEAVDFVGNSGVTVQKFYQLFFAALDNGEEISITYQ
jgi:hypothetical protein